MTPLVAITNLCKSFPGVRALHNAQFVFAAGEVHALMGENGAGKSTDIRKDGPGCHPSKNHAARHSARSPVHRFRHACRGRDLLTTTPEASPMTVSRLLQGFKTAAFSSNIRQKLLAFASLLGLLIFFNVASASFITHSKPIAFSPANGAPQAGNPP